MTDKYNGWANYETWVVNLWLTNDECMEEACREYANEALDDDGNHIDVAITATADWLDDMYTDWLDDLGPSGVMLDLLRHALDRVDWHEIAEVFVNEVANQRSEA